jgi:hypothetical protein
MPAGNQPDFYLYLSEKELAPQRNRRYYKIGAAWWNSSGKGLAIQLNPGTSLDDTLLKEYTLGLFPNDQKTKAPNPKATSPLPPSFVSSEDDDGIPF